MSTAIDVAQYLLNIAAHNKETFKPMKLLKMTYICYGYFSVDTDERLFSDEIEAWKFGPVIPTLYHKIKKYRNENIHQSIGGYVDNLTDSKKECIKAVYDAYKPFSGLKLSTITHLPDTPWSQVYLDGMKMEITDDYIKPYYKKLYENPNDFK